VSQRLIPTGEQSGLLTRIVATESVWLYMRMIQSDYGALTIIRPVENRFAQRLRGARN